MLKIRSLLYILPPLVFTVEALAAPSAEWVLPETIRATVPFVAELHVSWEGEAQQYVVLPATFEAPQYADMRLVEVAVDADAPQRAVQRFSVTPHLPGTVQFPAMELGLVFAPAAGDPAALAEREPAQKIPVALHEVQVAGAPQDLRPLIIGALALLVIACGLAYWIQRRRRLRLAASAAPLPLDEQVQAKLHEARRLRLDGDFYHFYQALGGAATLIAQDPETHALAAKLQMLAQQAGYGGVRPNDDDMNSHTRDVERALARYREERRP